MKPLHLSPIALATLSLLAGGVVTPIAHAQSQTPSGASQQITVTGTNIKRTESEGTSPILTLDSREIEQSGARNVLQLLQQITSAGVGGYVDTPDQNGFSRGVATASLRNFGSTSTLILINGRRLTPSAYANPNNGQSTLYDLNSIPLSALDRVEVLKDGASAVYGSDAIAGVINFITRNDYVGKTIGVSMGANEKGDFGSRNINGTIGFGDFDKDRYNVLISADATLRDRTMIREIDAAELEQYATMQFRLNPYFTFASASPFHFKERAPNTAAFFTTGNATSPNIVNRLNCDPSSQITGAAVNNIATSSFLFGRTFCNYDGWKDIEAQNKGSDLSLLMVGKYALSATTTLFAEAALNSSRREYLANPRTIDGRSRTTNFLVGGLATPFQAILPVGHPDNPFPDARSAVVYRFENLKTGNDLNNVNSRLLTGVRGVVGSWDFESALLFNRSKREEIAYGFLFLPTLRKLMTENRSLASLAADPTITKDLTNIGVAEIVQLDAKASTEFGKLAGGKIGFAAGVETREERLTINPDPANAAGDILGLATTAIDASRRVSSAFFEFRFPVLKGLEIDAAGRFDKYPGLSTNFVPKVGGKWTVNKQFALRSTYSEGFRAPALSQVAPGGAQFFTTVVDPIRCPDGLTPVPGATTTDCARSVSGVGGANPDLKPETSRSFTFGLILSPFDSTDVLIDAYRVKQNSEVALGSADLLLRNPDRFPADYITRDTTPLNQLTDANGNPRPGTGPLVAVKLPWTNQGSTEVTGVDVDWRYRYQFQPGETLSTSVRVTQLLDFRRAERPGDVTHDAVGTNGGLNDWATSLGSIARTRSTMRVTYDNPTYSFSLSSRFVSGISLLRKYDNAVVYPVPYCHYGTGQPPGAYSLGGIAAYTTFYPNCKVPSWTTFDMSYAYKGIKNTVVSLAILNVTDVPAPFYPGFTNQAHNASLHNVQGRAFRASVRYTF